MDCYGFAVEHFSLVKLDVGKKIIVTVSVTTCQVCFVSMCGLAECCFYAWLVTNGHLATILKIQNDSVVADQGLTHMTT